MPGRRSRSPAHATHGMRERLAHEAARVMAESGIEDFGLAKRKAAERLGVARRGRVTDERRDSDLPGGAAANLRAGRHPRTAREFAARRRRCDARSRALRAASRRRGARGNRDDRVRRGAARVRRRAGARRGGARAQRHAGARLPAPLPTRRRDDRSEAGLLLRARRGGDRGVRVSGAQRSSSAAEPRRSETDAPRARAARCSRCFSPSAC